MSGASALGGKPAVADARDLPFDALDVVVERALTCPMRDGVALVADVYRPVADVACPVLLMRTPYGRALAESDFAYAHPSWYAAHGYIVVVQDCRGRFASEGHWYPFRHEAADGYDTIEWAAGLPGSSGAVGMYGASYAGMVQLWAATLAPPALRAIAPTFAASQTYDGWVYNGGAFALAFALSWAAYLGVDSARRGASGALDQVLDVHRDPSSLAWSLPFRSLEPIVAAAPYWQDWLDHPTYDAYWKATSLEERYEEISVPALHIGGWYDVFLSGTVKNFVGLTAAAAGAGRADTDQRLVIGPWTHGSWSPVGPVGPAGPDESWQSLVDELHLRWFDDRLKDGPAPVAEPPVTAFVMGDGWRELAEWPPPGRPSVRWFLHSAGRANSSLGDGALSVDPPGEERPDVYVYDPLSPVPSCGGHSAGLGSPVGPADQVLAEAQPGVLVYTSAPFEQAVELLGDVEAVLHVASSVADSDVVVRLCVVDADGRSTNLQEGIVRMRHRESLEQAAPAAPGAVFRVTVRLGPVGVAIPEHHRLRVTVTSSDFPQWDRNLNTAGAAGTEAPGAAQTATQVVFHDRERPSFISLPIAEPRKGA